MRRSIFRHGGPFKVISRAHGLLTVYPGYDTSIPEACRSGVVTNDEHGANWCVACQCNHEMGVFNRIALAHEIESLLNRLSTPIQKKKKS